LWGKIYGTNKDYYVAEGEKDAPAAGEGQTEFAEARGNPNGVNKYMYWVTDSVTGKWIDLPDVTPDCITKARQIKHLFSGDVDSDVITNPYFKWKEKVLLRAQIARITQSTTLTPDGLWKKQEDNQREITEMGEEKKVLTFEQLSKLDAWRHLVPGILKVSTNRSINTGIVWKNSTSRS
jgi:hypothetical protein